MSDHDAAPDPIDQAYREAEAMLNDDDARAARRARVLTAVSSVATAPAGVVRRSAWRRGGWLAAASVAGIGVFLGAHLYPPALHPSPIASSSATPTAGASAGVVQDGSAAPAPETAPATPAPVRPPRPDVAASPHVAKVAPQARPDAPIAPPIALAPQAFPPPAPPAPPPPPAPQEVIVTAERRAQPAKADGAADEAPTDRAGAVARRARDAVAAPALAFNRSDAAARPQPDPAARLRAAAAAGRTAELETLLAQGVAIDAPDADGNTALMRSVQAGHAAAAALLHRRGASLDRRNHAGESARDMAAAKGDSELNQALDLDP